MKQCLQTFKEFIAKTVERIRLTHSFPLPDLQQRLGAILAKHGVAEVAYIPDTTVPPHPDRRKVIRFTHNGVIYSIPIELTPGGDAYAFLTVHKISFPTEPVAHSVNLHIAPSVKIASAFLDADEIPPFLADTFAQLGWQFHHTVATPYPVLNRLQDILSDVFGVYEWQEGTAPQLEEMLEFKPEFAPVVEEFVRKLRDQFLSLPDDEDEPPVNVWDFVEVREDYYPHEDYLYLRYFSREEGLQLVERMEAYLRKVLA